MLYSSLIPMKMYTNLSPIPLPRGEKVGFGNALFLTSRSQVDSIALLNSPEIGFKQSYYKLYYIDAMYKDKIGYKRITQNNASITKKTFAESEHPNAIRHLPYSSRVPMFKRNQNIIVDLGYWFDLYFKYSLRGSTKIICQSFMSFFFSRLNDTLMTDYKKTVIFDIAYWFKNKTLSFDRNGLTDPFSILIYSIYKYPELLIPFADVDFLIIDSSEGKTIKIPGNLLIKENYLKIKSRIAGFDKLKEIASVPEEGNSNISEVIKDPVKKLSAEKEKIVQKAREDIVNSVKRNFVGEIDDIANDIDDEDIEDQFSSLKLDAEIDNTINDYLNDNPELIDSVDKNTAVDEISNQVKKKVYIAKFMPERSEEKLKKISQLQNTEEKIIGLPSFENLDSKIIPESDFTECIKSNNPSILKSTFRNFDKSYNEKKLNTDIDEAVGIFKDATSKVFISNKVEEDTSDQLNLKKTLTYFLEDENGKKMKIKFDVPIIIDDKYLYLNGAKKIIQHQLVLKPLTKTGPDTVQIVSLYHKIIITRKGTNDLASNGLVKMLQKSQDKYNVKLGNASIKNKAYDTSIEFDIISKNFTSFDIGEYRYITEIDQLKEFFDKNNIKYPDPNNGNMIIGYNKKTKDPIILSSSENYIFKIIDSMDRESQESFKRNASVKRLMFAECTMLKEHLPIILVMLFFEGFTSVMKKANIKCSFIQDKKELKNFDSLNYGFTQLADGYLVWERYPLKNSLLMNGLQNLPTQLYTYNELDSKETYIYMLSQYHSFATQYQNLDQYKDFMIDNVTKEILMDYHMPTDIVSLMAYAADLLADNQFLPENNLNNMRLRSNELIAHYVYVELANAYNAYRKSLTKKNPKSITLKQNCILQDLTKDKLIEDNSVLNPVLELEKNRAVTYKGEEGINLEQAMTIPRRGYDESMLGVVGISTSPDKNVGVVHQLSLEPSITSTRGYINTHSNKSIDELNSANLLTPAELLTPLGVLHDDPTRTAMTYKQSKYMLLVNDAQPTLIGNKVEAAIPYHISDEFSIVAKDDGKIIDIKDGIVVIEYKSGEHKCIDTNVQVKKNAASGFYIESQLKCDKNIGDIVKSGEVVAYNPKAFQKDSNDLSASMNLGVLTKVAVIPSWDIYEDSAPITESLSERMATTMVSEISVALDKTCFVDFIAKVGDKVKTGDELLKFNQYPDDPYTMKLLRDIREDLKEELISNNISTIKSKYSGEIIDIKIFTTVPTSELDPSVQKIVNKYHSRISKKEKIADKYKNPDDYKYYKAGMLLSESADVLTPDTSGKIRGVKVDEGVLVIFYIKYTDLMKKGDKLTHLTALKGIVSNVIPKGLEPYSEYRPDEEISSIIAPLSITARKTPSIFLSMFGNKLLIELKRQLKDIYFNK